MTVRFDFAGQTVLVTGGAQGIGRSIVEGFAGSGARVLIADTPGPTCANMRRIPFTRVTRPFYPLDLVNE